jgi:hypothetical protein
MNGRLVLVVLLLFAFRPVRGDAAERKLRDITFRALAEQGALAPGLEVQPDGSLSLVAREGEGLTVTLVEIANPGITRDRYVVRGRVRYRGVVGDGYLEMWNVFGDGGRYFTRTLGDSGPLQKITGDSEWRDFGLYFDATGAKSPVEKLVIGLVLPGAGEVSLSDMTLVELDSAALRESTGWWGGIAGGILGVIGALLGTLAGAGRARTFVLGGLKALMAAGVVGLALGVYAFSRSAPYGTYYPLLLLSAIALAVPALSLPGVRKRYEEQELRRMRALDV